MQDEQASLLIKKHGDIISPLSLLYLTGQRDQFWKQVTRYGLSKEGFASRHPELLKQQAEFEARAQRVSKMTISSIVIGALASFVPIVVWGKNWLRNRFVQWAVALISSGAMGIFGGFLASRIFHKGVIDEQATILEKLNSAMITELAVAIERTQTQQAAPLPNDGFAAGIAREASPIHAQPGTRNRLIG
jgi:hypothetical protein